MLHMVAVGWLWVMLMVAITEKSLVAGVLTFVCYGLLPCGLAVYLFGRPARRRRVPREPADASIEKEKPPAGQDGAAPG